MIQSPDGHDEDVDVIGGDGGGGRNFGFTSATVASVFVGPVTGGGSGVDVGVVRTAEVVAAAATTVGVPVSSRPNIPAKDAISF